MNEHQLSQRLTAVANYIPTGSRIADIGTDHAYLPIHLLMQGKICSAIAGEINDGPFNLAKEQVENLGLQSVIEVRRGDGLEVIEQGEVDVVCIAGMGGALISRILSEGIEKLDKVQRLVLQPNVGSHLLREWLIDHKWELIEEDIIDEDQKYYEILVAEQGDPTIPYETDDPFKRDQAILMGPFLLQQKSEAFVQKWKGELDKKNKILHSLSESTGEEAEQKRLEFEYEKKMIEEGIKK